MVEAGDVLVNSAMRFGEDRGDFNKPKLIGLG